MWCYSSYKSFKNWMPTLFQHLLHTLSVTHICVTEPRWVKINNIVSPEKVHIYHFAQWWSNLSQHTHNMGDKHMKLRIDIDCPCYIVRIHHYTTTCQHWAGTSPIPTAKGDCFPCSRLKKQTRFEWVQLKIIWMHQNNSFFMQINILFTSKPSAGLSIFSLHHELM